MASKEQIKKAILDAAGNPDSGIVKENVDSWAEAVWALDNEVAPKSAKEFRVVEAKETR
jgi:hypothetical protein